MNKSARTAKLNKKIKEAREETQDAKISDYWRERTIFPGMVPSEVKTLMKQIGLNTFDKSYFRKMIKVALGYIQGTLSDEKCQIAFENLCRVQDCSSEQDVIELSVQYTGVISLLRAILKVNMKTVREDTLMHDLMELGLPEDFAADLCKIAFGPAHSDIMAEVMANNPHLTKLEKFDWNVDVTLSNSWCNKILEPSVYMKMKTSDGETHEFEVPMSAFHLLRQSTANMLRHIEALERRK